MAKSLSTKTRRKLLNSVLQQGTSVTAACRKFGVSRDTFYKWLKRYQASQELKDKPRRVRRFWHQASPELVEQVRKIALEHSTWSKYQIQQALPRNSEGQAILGVHGVYNILRRLSLSTPEKRSCQSPGRPRMLAPEERLAMINRVLRGGATVTQVCKELGISRVTFYKWLKRYKKPSLTQQFLALDNKRPQVARWWRQATPEQERLVLQVVVESPSFSKYKIAEKIKRISGQAVLGPHGIYNVLRRWNLTLPEARVAYAQKMAPVVKPTPWLDHLRLVWEKFIPQLAPAPPPRLGQLVKVFSTTFVPSLFLSLLLLFWLQILSGQPFATKIGLSFASLSLVVGTFFFLYSMKYYFTLTLVLGFSRQVSGGNENGSSLGGPTSLKSSTEVGPQQGKRSFWQRIFGGNGSSLGGPTSSRSSTEVGPLKAGGLQPDLSHVKLQREPFVSIHLPLYNEKSVVDRLLIACTSMNYDNYEVIVVDDSTDETTEILNNWEKHPRVKVIHRESRAGFKGGALKVALENTDPKTEFVMVFDADFIPYPDTITQFLKYFQVVAGGLNFQLAPEHPRGVPQAPHHPAGEKNESPIAAVQGYQWHVLNKSENWITRGVRNEYAGSYVVERSGGEILGALKQIAGSVYMIRKDILDHYGWGASITEDFELTLKLYRDGYKVVYTPYVQGPAECVSTFKRLIRQRTRWAEGHSHNIRKMFWQLIHSPKLTLMEKLEFLYLSPYYLQAAFLMIGTFSWFLAEAVFQIRLPFWTSIWGWSLVLTNFLSLPLMNTVGLFLEESERKDYRGIPSFILLSYLLAPFQAYAAVKGFLEKEEGPWFRTPKTGKITDIFTRGRFYRWIFGIVGRPSLVPSYGAASRPAFAPGGASAGKPAIAPAVAMTAKQFNNLTIKQLNPYLSLATANNQFDNFRISKKGIRKLSVSLLAVLLLLSSTLVFLAPTIPKFKPKEVVAGTFTVGPLEEPTPVSTTTSLPTEGISLTPTPGPPSASSKLTLSILKAWETPQEYWFRIRMAEEGGPSFEDNFGWLKQAGRNEFTYNEITEVASRQFLRLTGRIPPEWREKGEQWPNFPYKIIKGRSQLSLPLSKRVEELVGAELEVKTSWPYSSLWQPGPLAGVITISTDWDADAKSDGESYPEDTLMFAGYLVDWGTYRFAIRFPLSSLPSCSTSTISDADFKHYINANGGSAAAWDIHPYNDDGQADPEQDSGLTLYSRASPAGTPYLNDDTTWRTWTPDPITMQLPTQANTDIQNAKAAVNRFSLGVHEEGDNDLFVEFDAIGQYPDYEAKLILTYNAPPNTPTLDSPTNGVTDVSTTPQLKTTTTDSDSDNLKYKIQIATNSTFTENLQTFDQTVSQTGWSGQNADGNTAYTSGTQATYTIQSALSEGTTYYWRSYAIDYAGANCWSGTQSPPYSFTTVPELALAFIFLAGFLPKWWRKRFKGER